MESLMSPADHDPGNHPGPGLHGGIQRHGHSGNDLRLVLAHVTFCIPYVFLNVKSRLVGHGPCPRLTRRATWVPRPARVVRDITLPLCRPAILSGAFLALAMIAG